MKKIICLVLVLALAVSLCACTASYNVSHNMSQSADNFECLRRIRVYNARTDNLILDIEGYMSIRNNAYDELIVLCKTGENLYRKNYVYLNDYTLYVVEDIDDFNTDPYHYKVHYYFALPDIDINK